MPGCGVSAAPARNGGAGVKTRVLRCLLIGVALLPSAARAAFVSTGGGAPMALAATVRPGNVPSATVVGTTVNLSWTASTLSTGDPVTGYVIRRYDSTGTTQQTIASGTCAAVVPGTACSETSVPEGTWRYSVTPVHNNWRGAESATTPVTLDLTAPPSPTFTSTPPSSSNSMSASFSFTDAESGVTFECRRDGGAFAACTSPKQYSGLTTGSHTFEVRAVDGSGNRSAAASYTWTVNACKQVSVNSNFFSPASVTTTAGCSVVWTRVSGTHNTTSNTGVWTSQTLDTAGETFTFQFNTPGTYPYRCTFHPSTMTGTIIVNPAGDVTPPTAAVTFPASSTIYGATGWNAGCSTGGGDFCGTASDSGSGVTRVQVSIQQGSGHYWNGSGFGSTSEVFFDATGTTSWSYAFPATNFPTDDAYTIRAKATDDENNVSSVVSRTFIIDRTAPPTPTFTSTPSDPSTSTSASFSFTDAETGVTFECRIDAGTFSACTSPRSYSGLTAGTHTFEVRAVDAAGNRSGAASDTWTMQACSQVSVNNNFFSPTGVTIAAGCSVTWTRMAGTHTSTSTTGVWSSQTLDTAGETFTFQFDTAGTYPYRCNFHPGSMTGTITVT
jgi:plastocyanin